MIFFFYVDSVQDDWASSNNVVNPFSNNISGIFILKYVELIILIYLY